jgi:hypothetical protein
MFLNITLNCSGVGIFPQIGFTFLHPIEIDIEKLKKILCKGWFHTDTEKGTLMCANIESFLYDNYTKSV